MAHLIKQNQTATRCLVSIARLKWKEDPGKKNKRPRSQNNNHMNPLKCANMQCSRDRASQHAQTAVCTCMVEKCAERVRRKGYHSSKTHNPSNKQVRVDDWEKGTESREEKKILEVRR
jgi:hypothetical protein